MEKSSLKKWLTNPFRRIAGWRAFVIGLIIMIPTVWIGAVNNIYFSGAFDAKVGATLPIGSAFLMQLIGLASLVAVFYLVGKLFARGTRFQDILGTITLSRAPYLLIVFVLLFMPGRDAVSTIEGGVMEVDITPFMDNIVPIAIMTLITTVIIVWHFMLLFNAFSVSTGLAGAKRGWLFALSAVLAEVLSLAVIYFALN